MKMSSKSAVHDLAARAWRRIALRNVRDNDNHKGLNRLYAMPDPWGMASEREQSRFRQTNEIIRARIGRVDRILEVGCGEGHQSEHLIQLCTHLDGLDVSSRAVVRASERIPDGRFGVGHLGALPWVLKEHESYDLVVACEVLYYLNDVAHAVERMSRLGRTCFVTFFCPAARKIASHLDKVPGLERGWIYHEPYAWLWAMWAPPRK